MTNEEINIQIAEACGWTDIGKYDPLRGISPQWKGVTAYDGGKIDPPIWDIPDYCNDLNAMHEAEMGLSSVKAAEYARILTSMAWQSEQPVFAPMTATASQRAKAFLRTLNLWKE